MVFMDDMCARRLDQVKSTVNYLLPLLPWAIQYALLRTSNSTNSRTTDTCTGNTNRGTIPMDIIVVWKKTGIIRSPLLHLTRNRKMTRISSRITSRRTQCSPIPVPLMDLRWIILQWVVPFPPILADPTLQVQPATRNWWKGHNRHRNTRCRIVPSSRLAPLVDTVILILTKASICEARLLLLPGPRSKEWRET